MKLIKTLQTNLMRPKYRFTTLHYNIKMHQQFKDNFSKIARVWLIRLTISTDCFKILMRNFSQQELSKITLMLLFTIKLLQLVN